MNQISDWLLVDDSSIGASKMEGHVPSIPLAFPMMALCVVLELADADCKLIDKYDNLLIWAVPEIKKHIRV